LLQTLEVEQIYQAAHAVAHVGVPRYLQGTLQPTSYSGTGWMLTPTLAITCAHVLRARTRYETLETTDLEQQVANTLLTFDFLSSGRGTQVSISRLEYYAQEQDYAILRLEPPPGTTSLTIAPATAAITTQTALFILQHPLGQPQQGAFGKLVQAGNQAGIIHYRTPTEPGTSGAPVLNRQNWQVLALHQGESPDLELRQGCLMAHILADLAAQSKTLYAEIEEAQSRRK
jgi:V8-like Glu-specific endopeptidase